MNWFKKLLEALLDWFRTNKVYPGVTCGPAQLSTDGMYQVDVYKNGPKRQPVRCKVYQLQFDQTQAMPEDLWVMVLQMGQNYYMQTPVWVDTKRPEDFS